MTSVNNTRVVLLSALAWTVGLFGLPFLLNAGLFGLNLRLGYRLDPIMQGGLFTLMTSPLVGGGLAAYVTGALLRNTAGLNAIRPHAMLVIWLAVLFLSFIPAFLLSGLFLPPVEMTEPWEPPVPYNPPLAALLANGFVTWSVTGLLGGLMTAFEVLRKTAGSAPGPLVGIAAGWGIGFGLGGGLGKVVQTWLMYSASPAVRPGWVVEHLSLWSIFGFIGLFAGAVGTWAMLRASHSTALHPQQPAPRLEKDQYL